MNATKTSFGWFAVALVAVPVVFALASWAQATPPGRVNFQGMVQNSAGTPLDGPVPMIFRLP